MNTHEAKTAKSSYFYPSLTLGLEYHFKSRVSLALQPSYSYVDLDEIYSAYPGSVSSYGPFAFAYKYDFQVQMITLPLVFNYYTHADDEKSWIFSAGAGIGYIASLQAKAASVAGIGFFSFYNDTVYHVNSLCPGNTSLAIRSSITKKFKTKKQIKPYLRISYTTIADPWQFPSAFTGSGLYFMRPHYIGVELGFTIKKQAVRMPPAEGQTNLPGQ